MKLSTKFELQSVLVCVEEMPAFWRDNLLDG